MASDGETRRGRRKRCAAAASALALLSLAGCSENAERAASGTGGEAARGRRAIERYGCGACHTIPGIEGARATIGPSLGDLDKRPQLTGGLANTPDNLVRWVRHPQQVRPGTTMPDLGIGDRDARDIAAYLYR
ncbi:MAG: c-type cytochrome [Acidobacteria bacterium]|nr:c-type cytochrome [Acidobacteriota bacterium]